MSRKPRPDISFHREDGEQPYITTIPPAGTRRIDDSEYHKAQQYGTCHTQADAGGKHPAANRRNHKSGATLRLQGD